MGRIRILSDQVANQIAAGEVVDRPASVVKELLENAIDAGANRIRIEVEAGGRRLIRITDDGSGMTKDDALLAFERHATSKLRTVDDLLSIATLGFRGEALPSIASVARVTLETAITPDGESAGESSNQPTAGTRIEIAGGKILHVDEIAAPHGTTITVADLFFNTPARRKFLRAESTELAHVTALVTHYALVHPEKHFELLSSSHTLISAPPVAKPAERIFQILGQETHSQLLPVAAELQLARAGLPEPPPWKKDQTEPPRAPGYLRMSGFFSKPELQKLNRNSIYIFVNKRLIRDRSLLHAITEAYRNVIPPTSFPVVLLYLEMPPEEVDVNVHPAKTEVRFRQQTHVHDFVRDSLRTALIKARPAAGFLAALESAPTASPSLLPQAASHLPGIPDSDPPVKADEAEAFQPAGAPARLPFSESERPVWNPSGLEAIPEFLVRASALFTPPEKTSANESPDSSESHTETEHLDGCSDDPFKQSPFENTQPDSAPNQAGTLNSLASLRPLGQLRESFILAVGEDGLWIIDQHVAHERVLFEKILRDRQVEKNERQRLLMPLLVELKPWQMVIFAEIADELEKNGFEVEPFGPQTLAVKAAPIGLEGKALERMLAQVIEQAGEDSAKYEQNNDLSTLRSRIAASIACHAAIKVNMPLDLQRMEWLLSELAKTNHPTNCPHGRPIALHYSWKDIQKAFQRI
jgi:DNA mismatch repair protein MutL